MKKKRRPSKRVPRTPPGELNFGPGFPHILERPDRLFAPPPPIVETVFFSRVGHTFKQLPPSPFGGPDLYAVQDFLLDQTGTSGADGKMAALKAFDLTTAVSYRFNLWPKDRAKKIKVVPPPTAPVFFALDIGRRFVNAVSDYADFHVPTTFFVNLQGAAPVFSYNAFFIGHNTNHWARFQVMGDIASAMAFHGFTTFAGYPPRTFDPGLKSYIPNSFSLPFNLPSPNSVPYVMFGYTTPDPVDPGPCVTLG